jgi:hypothetical protein
VIRSSQNIHALKGVRKRYPSNRAAADVRLRVDSHCTTRHDTTRQNIVVWFSSARIHTSPSRTANDKKSTVGFERREYFAYMLTDGRCACTLVFVVPCRRVVPCNANRFVNRTAIGTGHVWELYRGICVFEAIQPCLNAFVSASASKNISLTA